MMLYSLDVETTGLDPLTCKLREVALVPLDSEFNVAASAYFNRRICLAPGEVDDAFNFHGIPADSGHPFREVQAELREFLRPLSSFALCGRNVAGFDAILLRRAVGQDVWNRCDYHMRDSAALQLAMQDAGLLPPGRLSLRTLMEALGLPWSGEAHRAYDDAVMEARVYAEMVKRLKGSA
jgi:DNA polymerase III epsilon subunit-like protein